MILNPRWASREGPSVDQHFYFLEKILKPNGVLNIVLLAEIPPFFGERWA
jgi:hypothetical protein